MCGIAGIIARQPQVELRQAIRAMTERVRHRGPDDGGVSVRGQVALGHRRLSVVDLSRRGHQPMEYGGGRYAITYNGEIYNYLELRAELKDEGFLFHSDTDTEVILAAYDAWGHKALSRFNGMWAFAIHDNQKNLVFAARDRFGVKPFYYTDTERCFAFGSEIRQLLPLLPTASANFGVTLQFLLTGINVQSERTSFMGISSLLPGHWLEYHVDIGSCIVHRYYDLGQRVAAIEPVPETEAIDSFRATLEEAIALRLRSDVRVGACLSGGLDSSSIALLASRMYEPVTNRPLTAITAVSEDPRNNEEFHAQRVVEAGSLDWIKVRPNYDDFCRLLPHVVTHQEEPFGSPSVCMGASVFRAAREHGVTVLLDGQGADETLLGYERYYPAYALALWREGGIGRALQGIHASVRTNANLSAWRLTAYMMLGLIPEARYLYHFWQNRFLDLSPPLPNWFRQFASNSWNVRALQVFEIETAGLPDLLRFEDKNSMAYAIETRLPFLDYRLVEGAIALPTQLKMHRGWTKYILRQSMTDVLPTDIAWRRDKVGFEAPTEIWLSRHEDAMWSQVRQSPLLRRMCNERRLTQVFCRLDRNTQWRLYSLALWEEGFNIAN
jgi:asparagine synthase (glutamine-hydrolysing)